MARMAGEMRIFVASLSTETNTFTPMPTTRDDFRIYNPGPSSEGRAKPHPAYTILHRRAAEEGFVVVEGLGAGAPPSGTVRQDAYEEFRDEIVEQVAAAMPLDGVVLGLHGASRPVACVANHSDIAAPSLLPTLLLIAVRCQLACAGNGGTWL